MLSKLFGRKKTAGEKIEMKIGGMHCSSCAMDIDFALEDLPGVLESKTNYASAKVEVKFDPEKVEVERIKKEISKKGYTING